MNPSENSYESRGELLRSVKELWRCTVDKPVRRLRSEQLDLFAKLEYGGFSGSAKDRAALGMIEKAIERGEIRPDTVIVESTSGNLGLALSSLCRCLGLRFIAVVDPLVNRSTDARLKRLCYEVITVRERDVTGGYLLNRRKTVFEQKTRFEHVFFPNQYDNPDNYMAYYNTLGKELTQQLPELDYLFVAVSSGGTITGVSRRLKETSPQTRIIAVDVHGSVIFGGPPSRRHVTGLGSSLVPSQLNHAYIDEVMHISEHDIVRGSHELLQEQAIFAGASSGACYSAIKQYFSRGTSVPNRRPRVAFVCPDSGDGYLDTVYDPEWVKQLERDQEGLPRFVSSLAAFKRQPALEVKHAVSR